MLTSMQDAVTVVGYPIGGESISVTSGVVSRIEVWIANSRIFYWVLGVCTSFVALTVPLLQLSLLLLLLLCEPYSDNGSTEIGNFICTWSIRASRSSDRRSYQCRYYTLSSNRRSSKMLINLSVYSSVWYLCFPEMIFVSFQVQVTVVALFSTRMASVLVLHFRSVPNVHNAIVI